MSHNKQLLETAFSLVAKDKGKAVLIVDEWASSPHATWPDGLSIADFPMVLRTDSVMQMACAAEPLNLLIETVESDRLGKKIAGIRWNALVASISEQRLVKIGAKGTAVLLWFSKYMGLSNVESVIESYQQSQLGGFHQNLVDLCVQMNGDLVSVDGVLSRQSKDYWVAQLTVSEVERFAEQIETFRISSDRLKFIERLLPESCERISNLVPELRTSKATLTMVSKGFFPRENLSWLAANAKLVVEAGIQKVLNSEAAYNTKLPASSVAAVVSGMPAMTIGIGLANCLSEEIGVFSDGLSAEAVVLIGKLYVCHANHDAWQDLRAFERMHKYLERIANLLPAEEMVSGIVHSALLPGLADRASRRVMEGVIAHLFGTRLTGVSTQFEFRLKELLEQYPGAGTNVHVPDTVTIAKAVAEICIASNRVDFLSAPISKEAFEVIESILPKALASEARRSRVRASANSMSF